MSKLLCCLTHVASTDIYVLFHRAVNNPTTIKFTVTADQASGNLKVRVGTTLSFAGGRPVVTINNWTSSSPAAPTKIDSRGLTRGAYRGYGEVYTWDVPAGTVKSGSNTMTIKVLSGSSGDKFLSPNFVSQPPICVDMGRDIRNNDADCEG